MRIGTIELVHRANLVDVIGNLEPICLSVSHNDEALILLAEQQDVDVVHGFDVEPGWATFPHSKSMQHYDGTVIIHDGHSYRSETVKDVGVAYPHLQMFPDGEILLVGARCWREADGTRETNALVYHSGGKLSGDFVLGDGIQDVLIAEDGSIWTSYFDEGIYGSYGWGSYSADRQYVRPIGASGLVRFDKRGRQLWEFSSPSGFQGMDDCYAVNVAHDATWAYYYSEFALVRVGFQGEVRAWKTGISGARAFAVHDNRVLMFGGYGSDESRIVLGSLSEHSIEHRREYRLPSPLDGRGFRDGLTAVGRGPVVHLFADRQWYQVDLRTLLDT